MLFALLGLIGLLGAGCGDKTPPPNPPCERECQDAIALRAIREMMKFAFNTTFQAQPVGYHDLTANKFLKGTTARVFGTATANGEQGVTDVCLTYVFKHTLYAKKQDEPKENYSVFLEGTITQQGRIAVQPSAPTALKMRSKSVVVVSCTPFRVASRPTTGAAVSLGSRTLSKALVWAVTPLLSTTRLP